MTKEVIVFDKNGVGSKKLATIKLGHERLENFSSYVAGKAFIICKEHGTSPAAWVRTHRPAGLFKCCRLCVKAHCQLSMAVPNPGIEDYSHDHSY